MHALEEDIAKYKGKYDAGYDAIRQARFERVKNSAARSPRKCHPDRRQLGQA